MGIKTRLIDPLADKYPRKQRKQSPFIASIPLPWLLAALRAERPVSVTRICLAYWFRRLTRNNPEVRLSNEFAADFDMSETAKRRAVDSAVAAGLLEIVERKPGRSPVVRLPDKWEGSL
jgi:hypothetical protein